ncbi:MAG: sulfatase family protein [Planctomycetota bacterium]|jgi:arylsulfatase A-like enzyme
MRFFLWIIIATFVAATQVTHAADRPNVVVIYADDLGYGDISCQGATMVRTPNIDRLAARGRRFTDAHTASAVCTPSRYTLLTGRYPSRHGNLWGPVFLKVPLVVDPDRVTVADVMRRAGYATGIIGKWHLGFQTAAPVDWNKPLRPGPLELGFDYYFGMPVVNSHPPFVYVENDRVVGWEASDPFVYGRVAETRMFDMKRRLDEIGGADKAHALYDDERVGTTLTEKAVEWIGQREGEPFFLYFATTNIHHPFTPAPRFKGTSEAGVYGDFIHELDWMVGELMGALERAGVADNTLVIFTSDNGGMLNRGGQEAWRRGHRMNGPLMGFKFDAWEGGHRVPFIVRWPARVQAGGVSDALISNVDLMATLAGLVGVKLGRDEGEDSFDVGAALTGPVGAGGRDELLIAPLRRSHLTLRQGDWVYIDAAGTGGFMAPNVGDNGFGGPIAHRFTGQTHSDIEDGKLKPDAPKAQLYNLREDPGQRVNVIREFPEIAAKMRSAMDRIQEGATAEHAR